MLQTAIHTDFNVSISCFPPCTKCSFTGLYFGFYSKKMRCRMELCKYVGLDSKCLRVCIRECVCGGGLAYDSGYGKTGRGSECVGWLTNTGAIVASQLETRLTLAGEWARDINTAMLTVAVPALVNVWKVLKHRIRSHINQLYSSLVWLNRQW